MHKTTKVRIMGEDYPIRSDAEEEYLKSLARFVEEKIGGIAAEPFPPRLRREILAALLIADDLFSERKRNAELQRRITEMAAAVDTVVSRDLVPES